MLTKEGNEILRNYKRPNERVDKEQSYKFVNGTTRVLTSSVKVFGKRVEVVDGDAMDMS